MVKQKLPKPKPKQQPKPKAKKPKSKRRKAKTRVRSNMTNLKQTALDTMNNRHKALEYMDAQGKTQPPASSTSLGMFTTLPGVQRWVGSTATTADQYYVFQFTPSSIRGIFWNKIGAGDNAIAAIRINQLQANPGVSMRPLRYSVCVRSTGTLVNTAGMMRALMTSNSLDWSAAFSAPTTVTAAFCTSIESMVLGAPTTRSYTLNELTTGYKSVFFPVSNVGYNEWQTVTEAATIQDNLVEGSVRESLSTLILCFPTSGIAVPYEIVLYSQDAVRYPANTILSSMQRAPQLASSGAMERIYRHVADVSANGIHDETVLAPRSTQKTSTFQDIMHFATQYGPTILQGATALAALV